MSDRLAVLLQYLLPKQAVTWLAGSLLCSISLLMAHARARRVVREASLTREATLIRIILLEPLPTSRRRS